MLGFARLFLVILVVVNTAQGFPCLVESTNHGGGLFSYTFRRGDDPYVWRLGTNGGFILLQSHRVLEVQDAPGWTHSISSSGLITWTVPSGIQFLDEPVTFSVRSSLTDSVTYAGGTNGNNIGRIIGTVYELPGRTNYLGGGFQSFGFVGPALPSLSVSRNGTSVTVSWAADVQGLQLEASERSGTLASWSSVTNVPVIVDSKFTVELPSSDPQKFFRLASPSAP